MLRVAHNTRFSRSITHKFHKLSWFTVVLIASLWIQSFNSFGQDDTASLILKRLDASDIDQPKNLLDQQVTTASRSGQSVANLPVSIHVITQEEIRLNGYVTLVDALKSVPGIKTSKPGNGYEGETFLMRGLLGNSYAKILINGIPIQPYVKGSIGIGEQLPIAQAKRIEIIFGPSSSVYGLDAMAGVINIITETPESGTIAHANLVVGNDNYRHIDFSIGGKTGKDKNVLQYLIYGNNGQRDDLNIRHNTDVFNTFDYAIENSFLVNPAILGNPDVIDFIRMEPDSVLLDFYRGTGADNYEGTVSRPRIANLPHQSYSIGAKLNFRNFQFGFDEMYRRDHSSLGREPFLFSYANPEAFIGERTQRISLSYRNDFGKVTLTSNMSYLKYRMDFLSSSLPNYSTGFATQQSYVYEASDDLFGEVLINYTPNQQWDLLGGVAYQLNSFLPLVNEQETPFAPDDYRPFKNTLPPPHELYGNFGHNPQIYRNFSMFLQALYQKNRFTLLTGLRLETPSNYSVSATTNNTESTIALPASLRLGMAYKVGSTGALRFSLSSGFRSPPPSLAFASLALPDQLGHPDSISYERLPNPELLPEFSTSVELGYRQTISDKFYIDVAFFLNTVYNSITSQLSEPDPLLYPLASLNAVIGEEEVAVARIYQNDGATQKTLMGMQLSFRAKDLEPRFKTSIDAYLTLSGGNERLPNITLSDTTIVQGEIDRYRGMPSMIAQLNVSVQPSDKWYLRLENVVMSDWMRVGINNVLETERAAPVYKPITEGFYNLDFVGRYQISKNLQGFVKVINVFNSEYGGIGATGLDVDLFYNPQLKRNIQFGITFTK